MTRTRRTRRQEAEEHPETLGFLAFLREIERSAPDQPRIGRNARLAEEVVRLRQDPFLTFPAGDITAVSAPPGLPVEVNTRVLGYFGPQGALPLHLTVEMMQAQRALQRAAEAKPGDPSANKTVPNKTVPNKTVPDKTPAQNTPAFVAFAEMFSARFLQLLFRTWSDARAITQFDHPHDDRFQTYLGAFMGLASPALRARAAQAGFSLSTLPLAGVIGARIHSPVRLRQILQHLIGIALEVEENVPMWLRFEPEDQNRLGQGSTTLGYDCMLGQETLSVSDRICLHLDCPDLATYRSFLPGGAGFRQIVSVCDVYLGVETAVDIAPGLPRAEVPGLMLDGSAALGWTAWLDPTLQEDIWPEDTEPEDIWPEDGVQEAGVQEAGVKDGLWRRDAVFDTHPMWGAGG